MNALWAYLTANAAQIGQWSVATVVLAVAPLAVGLVLSIPLGWLAYRYRPVGVPLLPAAKVLYTIPSIVLFLVLPGVLGTRILDPVNVGVTLTLYTMALLIPAAAEGLRAAPAEVLAAASAMGQSGWQRFWAVHLPVSIPVLAAAVRVAAVSNVALISVASVIGTAQLGQLFILGTNLSTLTPIVLGLIFFIVLALLMDAAVITGTRVATPWLRRARG